MRDSFSSDRFQGALFAQWFAEARAVARRLSARPDTREDLAHEALLRVLEHPPERENAGAWIERICHNLNVDAWREVARAQRRAQQDDADGSALRAARSAEETVLADERRRVVRRALLALPRPQRRALILRFYGGWSFDRIAARLGMREATMRTRVHRALAALRAHVAAVRSWIMPGALSLKPALAVLIVVAAGGNPLVARRPASLNPPPSAPATAPTPASGHGGARSRRVFEPRPAIVADGATLSPVAPNHQDTRLRAEALLRVQSTAQMPSSPALQRFDFEEDVVTGILQYPGDDGVIEAALPSAQPSLIELRRHFLPEIVKSLEDL